jgi:hypothetical protein
VSLHDGLVCADVDSRCRQGGTGPLLHIIEGASNFSYGGFHHARNESDRLLLKVHPSSFLCHGDMLTMNAENDQQPVGDADERPAQEPVWRPARPPAWRVALRSMSCGNRRLLRRRLAAAASGRHTASIGAMPTFVTLRFGRIETNEPVVKSTW